MRAISRPLVALAILASLLSFVKFQHCRDAGWGAPDVYIHMCYSDITALYSERGMDTHDFPYASATNSVEYPVVTGLVMWSTSFLVTDKNNPYRNYFDMNLVFLILLLLGAALLVHSLNPEFSYLLPLSPAVVASLFINWDLWAVIAAIASLYFFARDKRNLSAVFLGISVATKFFPIVFLLPFALHSIYLRRIKNFLQYCAITLFTWLVINLPIAFTHFDGWSRFYTMNFTRQADWGSLWYALTKFGANVGALNYLAVVVTLVLILGLTIFYSEICKTRSPLHNLFLLIFLTMAAFTTINKVYSPQYVLWLTPFAVLALNDKKERSAFWIWQTGEALYHFAIWQYLAQFTGAKFGLPENWYLFFLLLRIATLIWFCIALMRSALALRSTTERSSKAPLLEFLSRATEGYA